VGGPLGVVVSEILPETWDASTCHARVTSKILPRTQPAGGLLKTSFLPWLVEQQVPLTAFPSGMPYLSWNKWEILGYLAKELAMRLL
jgi:hypothetical protein